MKQFLPFVVICLCACHLHASPRQRTMVVTTASSEVTKIEVTPQTRITFSDDQKKMIISAADTGQSQTLDVDDIVNIVFTIDSTSELTGQSLDDLKISYSGGIVTISRTGSILYSLWDMSGAMLGSGMGSDSVELDLTSLSKGVYIIKANDSTVKFIKH